MVQERRSQRVGKVAICILICGRGYYHNFRVNEINQILSKLCHELFFHFFYLRKVGLYLQESGKIIFARKLNLFLNLC